MTVWTTHAFSKCKETFLQDQRIPAQSTFLNWLLHFHLIEMHTTFTHLKTYIKLYSTASPPTSPPESALAAFDMTRLSLWNLYHNQPSPPEPQKEPINLEKREDPVGPPPPKRHQPDTEETKMAGTHIKISSRSKSLFYTFSYSFFYNSENRCPSILSKN